MKCATLAAMPCSLPYIYSDSEPADSTVNHNTKNDKAAVVAMCANKFLTTRVYIAHTKKKTLVRRHYGTAPSKPPALVVKDKWFATICRVLFLFSNNLLSLTVWPSWKLPYFKLWNVPNVIPPYVQVFLCVRMRHALTGRSYVWNCHLLILRDNHAELTPLCCLLRRWKRPHFDYRVIRVCVFAFRYMVTLSVETYVNKELWWMEQWFLYSMYLLS